MPPLVSLLGVEAGSINAKVASLPPLPSRPPPFHHLPPLRVRLPTWTQVQAAAALGVISQEASLGARLGELIGVGIPDLLEILKAHSPYPSLARLRAMEPP